MLADVQAWHVQGRILTIIFFFVVAKMNVSHEVELLVEEMKRLGKVNSEGKHVVTFGTLFNDDKCANLFEG